MTTKSYEDRKKTGHFVLLVSGSLYEKACNVNAAFSSAENSGLKVHEGGPIFSGIPRRQERGSFVCKRK